MWADERSRVLALRLRTIQGHLAAVGRLAQAGHTIEAAEQLRAVRGALEEVAIDACRRHLEQCSDQDAGAAARELSVVVRSRLSTRSRSRSR